MNLRVVGFGGILGVVVFLFSELLLISWTGEVAFIEPNKTILLSEIFITLILMIFVSFLLVEEFKGKKQVLKSKN